MSRETPTLFSNALEKAVKKTEEIGSALDCEITLVRDLRGRLRVLLPGSGEEPMQGKKEPLARLASELSHNLGRYGYPPDQMILYIDDLGGMIWDDGDRRRISETEGHGIWLLDRQITGQDWERAPFERKTKTRRVTFFGIKGGVGRSTALIIWAWKLAKQGKKVLIFDLDLESPGISSTLLPLDHLPNYGIVDWFVEDGVGQAEFIENEMVASSPLARNLPGEIRIVPAFGSDTGDYLPKLARCYSGKSTESGVLTWGERLERMVEQIEEKEKPDVVFLDSRAGIDDIAAVLVTRMGADTFLFAVDSPQTWAAYALLFRHWKEHPQVRDFRGRLQIVAGMVPETGREAYLKRFGEHSWDLFRDSLYDEESPGTGDAFNFDLSSGEAPHFPLPIFWHRALQEFDPAREFDEKTAMESLDRFMREAEKMVFSMEVRDE